MCQLGAAFSPVLQQLYKIGSGEAGWLDPDIVELEQLEHFLRAYPSAEKEAYPVSNLVNSPKHDAASIITPVAPPQQ
jgi:putative SOS response-associated peptidase YedK